MTGDSKGGQCGVKVRGGLCGKLEVTPEELKGAIMQRSGQEWPGRETADMNHIGQRTVEKWRAPPKALLERWTG